MSDFAIRAENLSKFYKIGKAQRRHDNLRDAIVGALQRSSAADHIWALRDVSFEVERGEVLGIIGRNGAGKSTLLKILSRITEPTTGRATIRGRVNSLLEVGTGFHQELTGRENVYLSGAIMGMKKEEIDRKFDEIVEFSGVGKFLDTPFKRYSSGMRVRLGFALAAHMEPEVLLVDEVLAVGDIDFQRKSLGKMGEVAKAGRTVLFVSHRMGAIMDLTTRCMLLESGRVVSHGPSHQIVEGYLRQNCSTLSRDLSTVKRAVRDAHEPHCQITNVRILAPEDRLSANEPIEVELGYNAHKDLDDVVIGIGIANMFGTRLISCRSDDDGIMIDMKAGESGIIVACIESPYLVSGRYILQLVAMRKTKTVDYIGDALNFEIAGDLDDSWALNRPNLGVRLPSKWQYRRR